MPIGPYATFDVCVADQKNKGHSDVSARKICGAMKRDLEGSISASEQDAQRRLIESAGMPFPIAEDKQHVVSRLYLAGHPYEKDVPISLLTATQRDYDTDKVIDMMGKDNLDPIMVIKHLNRYVIDDGHHRAMAAKYKGDRMVPALVVEA